MESLLNIESFNSCSVHVLNQGASPIKNLSIVGSELKSIDKRNHFAEISSQHIIKKLEHFMGMQSSVSNAQELDQLLSVSGVRLKITHAYPREYLFGFLCEFWHYDLECFRLWVKLMKEFKLYTHYRMSLVTLYHYYGLLFGQATRIVETIPLLYLTVRIFNDFSDIFRQLTGMEWCPIEMDELEVILITLLDADVVLGLDELASELTSQFPVITQVMVASKFFCPDKI